ncbi:MAG: DUF393 domain-containing protein [Bacteroidia bacterium]|nr:DUF393 domain-containing protein [Bacteroidia bacterium]
MKTTIIYDGFCDYCNGFVNWMLTVVNTKKVNILPCHLLASSPHSDNIKPEACNKYIHVITPDRKIYWGADAVREIWLLLDHWSRPFAYFLKLPGVIHFARIIYRIVSSNRNHI